MIYLRIGKDQGIVKQFNLNADRKRLGLGMIEGIDSEIMKSLRLFR